MVRVRLMEILGVTLYYFHTSKCIIRLKRYCNFVKLVCLGSSLNQVYYGFELGLGLKLKVGKHEVFIIIVFSQPKAIIILHLIITYLSNLQIDEDQSCGISMDVLFVSYYVRTLKCMLRFWIYQNLGKLTSLGLIQIRLTLGQEKEEQNKHFC